MKILIATDGSEYSLEAARECCETIKFGADSEIRILSVIEPIAPTAPFGVADDYYIQAQDAMKTAAEKAAEETRDEIADLKTCQEINIETQTITGRPKQAILDEAETYKPDLIVVGSHGRGFWGRAFLGSVSGAIVKHATCSVLVVRKPEGG